MSHVYKGYASTYNAEIVIDWLWSLCYFFISCIFQVKKVFMFSVLLYKAVVGFLLFHDFKTLTFSKHVSFLESGHIKKQETVFYLIS